MLIRYSPAPASPLSATLASPNISSSVPLAPRLEYAIKTLDAVITTVSERTQQQRASNMSAVAMISSFDELDRSQISDIKLEYRLLFSLQVLLHVRERTQRISHISGIPEILLAAIPMIRTTSAQLFDVLPDCSGSLSEISMHLGSVVLDSAFLATTKFDLNESRSEISALHDQVKLIVNSKLNKQYPNLDSFGLDNV